MRRSINATYAALVCNFFVSVTTAIALEPIAIYATGVDNNGNVIADSTVDPHWQVTQSPDASYPGPSAYSAVSDAFPIGPWLANTSASKWIKVRSDADTEVNPGTYVYTQTFDLTGLDPTTVQLTGQFSSDDQVDHIELNGVNKGQGAALFDSWHDFSITGNFTSGLNTLSFYVVNGGSSPNPHGFRAEISGTADLLPDPKYAWNPSPADNAGGAALDSSLTWSSGDTAISHDAYFGTSESAVANAQRLAGDINGDGPVDILDLSVLAAQWLTNPGAVSPSADVELSGKVDIGDFAAIAATWHQTPDPEFKGNQSGTTYVPGTLTEGTTYYWRIDEVNASQADSPWIGTVWSFTTTAPRLMPEQFPILPWSEPWRYWGPSDSQQVFEDIYDCGFNIADFVTPYGLNYAEAAGLKGIVFDSSLHVLNGTNWDQATCNYKAQTAVNSYGNHSALFAYYLRDEPGADLYPTLGRLVDAFHTYDPDHLSYINLFPNYADSDQMDVSTYQQYVDSYVSTVQPDYISYDHYGLSSSLTVSSAYWSNLSTIRTAAQNNGIPFWNIVCAVKRTGWPTPSPATLRFQLYTSLAYGAGGIGWYQYFNWADGLGVDFSLAPIAADGSKTNTWYYLRDVNLQMHQIGQTYINLNNVGVYHGSSPSGWSISGSDLLVGDFDQIGTGQSFVMVVNKSLTTTRSYTVSESLPGSVYYVSASDGQLYPLSGTLTLAAGEGRLLTVQ